MTASDGAAGDGLGYAVAVDGGTVVVGATGGDGKVTNSGSAYTYRISDRTAILLSAPGETNATSYTVTGLSNQADYAFAIRAVNDTGAGPASDHVTASPMPPPVPSKPTGLAATPGDTQVTLTWDDPGDSSITHYEYEQLVVTQLRASDGEANDWFGRSVAVDGDAMVVGAYGDDVKGVNSGSAYVFTNASGVWRQVAKLTPSDGASNDLFGRSVAIDGDTVVVGAHGNDDGGADSGSAYAFTKPGSGWADTTETAKLTASDGAAGDRFGRALSMNDDTVAVGAPRDDDNGVDSGSAYVFTKPGSGWADIAETAKLTASDGEAGDNLGVSVAVHGDTVVVGANLDDVDENADAGSAHVFTKSDSGWVTGTETAKLIASEGAAYDYFGYSASIDGDAGAVGAHRDDGNGINPVWPTYLSENPACGANLPLGPLLTRRLETT